MTIKLSVYHWFVQHWHFVLPTRVPSVAIACCCWCMMLLSSSISESCKRLRKVPLRENWLCTHSLFLFTALMSLEEVQYSSSVTSLWRVRLEVILDVFHIISLSSHIASWFHTDSLHSSFIIFLPVLRGPTLIFLSSSPLPPRRGLPRYFLCKHTHTV